MSSVDSQQQVSQQAPGEFFIESVTSETSDEQPDRVFVDIKLGTRGHKVNFKLDTGAQVNIIPTRVHQQIGQPQLEGTMHGLFSYSGNKLDVKGKCKLQCQHKNMSPQELTFYVVDTQSSPVLSLQACLSLQLIQLVLSVEQQRAGSPSTQEVLHQYSDIFDGLGLFPGEYSIKLDPTVQPVVHAPRRVPLALKPQLKEELDRMTRDGVVVKVDEPTDWVNSLVIVEKPRTKRLRLCLDPRDLNTAVKREHYVMPTLDDITSKLAGSKYFSILDARSGYWQIKLDERSSKLTTFNTPFGRYRFTRMPFGINCAQDIFQKKVDETYEGLDGVTGIADDIIVHGSSVEEHMANLEAMLQRSRDRGVKLNLEKCIFCVTEVPFFGHILSADGLKPDPAKITAIKNMDAPANRAELGTVLGMINYLSKFSSKLTDVTAPLRELLKKENEFQWEQQQESSFQCAKDLLTQEPGPVLAYFDETKEVVLQVDASQSGLGAALLQEGKPVAYASKSLTDTEQRWAQIEKEMYAIAFGCKRYHQFIYGRPITVVTDHKPLESILKKPLSAAPARLQRLMLRLQKYEMTVVHRAGKDIPLADTLSRKFQQDSDSSIGDSTDIMVHTVLTNLPMSDEKLRELRDESEKDPQMQALSEVILSGWPETRKQCPIPVQEYWNHRDELSVMDGLVFRGDRLVIPKALRSNMLKCIHHGYMGMEKCKERARDILFWPGMNAQIEETVSKCQICLENRPSNTKEPMIAHEVPDRPWQSVATDLFSMDGETYLVIVDYYSRYFEIERLQTTTSASVIRKTKAVFSRHGIPEKVISDNGPQYSSADYATFARTWGFKHETSSPTYPQSNGLAEKYVQIAKHLLGKAKRDAKDPYLSLLEYRNTPIDGIASPAQLLMSRRLRSFFPSTGKQLQPQTVNADTAKKGLHRKQQRQKSYYDRTAAPLKPLYNGESVRVQQKDGRWKPAVTTGQASTPRSYHIRTEEGGEYTRNRRHLLKTGEHHSFHEHEGQQDEPHRHGTPAPATPAATPPVAPAATPLSAAPSPAKTPAATPKPQAYTTRYGRTIKPRKLVDV